MQQERCKWTENTHNRGIHVHLMVDDARSGNPEIGRTGRKGEYRMPHGVIEFTHTCRPVLDILEHTFFSHDRPLRITSAATAWRDLKRVGRNTHLVDHEALKEHG